jgi:lipopolysaccharide heptosyltransferase II
MQGQAPRILIRGVNWLGDAVMTTPALQRLREARPNSYITLLTHEKLADLWQGHPAVNSVLTFAASDTAWSIARRLSEQNFDTALVLPNSPRSALEVWLARIPQRIGYARPWRNWFLTQAVPSRKKGIVMRKRSVAEINRLINNTQHTSRNTYPQDAHQLHEYLHLAAVLGASPVPTAPYVHVAPSELQPVTTRFGLKPEAEPIFGLNPGAEYGPAKRWPAERFISAAVEIQRQTRCRWLIFGGPAELSIAREIEMGIRNELAKSANTSLPLNLAGKTTLRELCVLLKLCRAILTNDSGPMHVAAAVGTPVVVPFGSTSPELTGPGLPGDSGHQLLTANAPCSPCFLRACPIDFRCMADIPVERVVDAFLKAVSKRNA